MKRRKDERVEDGRLHGSNWVCISDDEDADKRRTQEQAWDAGFAASEEFYRQQGRIYRVRMNPFRVVHSYGCVSQTGRGIREGVCDCGRAEQ